MTISERMFQILDEKGKKAADLCKILNVNNSQATNWKNRKTDPPAKYIIKICDFLETTPEFLLTGIDVNNLPVKEIQLIENFRILEEEEQEMILKKIKKLLPENQNK